MNQVEIRCFDLGGGGLKTALFSYNHSTNEMKIEQSQVQLGKCPGAEKVEDWIRRRMNENGMDLDKEVKLGHLFGFSLAGLDKLRDNRQVETDNMAILFRLPELKVSALSDGAAHTLASVTLLKGVLPIGQIWNFSIGTGVGFGLTDSKHDLQPPGTIKKFFNNQNPWDVFEPTTNTFVWKSCGSRSGFDSIVSDITGSPNNKAFELFATRWKAFIETQIIDRAKTNQEGFGDPSAVVFTGGNIDHYGDRLVQAVNHLGIKGVQAYKGPNNAGLYGAAFFAIKRQLELP